MYTSIVILVKIIYSYALACTHLHCFVIFQLLYEFKEIIKETSIVETIEANWQAVGRQLTRKFSVERER